MKIVVGMATFDARREYAMRAIKSLEYQVDQIVLYDNSINPDITDNGKFYALQTIKEPAYFFSCDDDIIYPVDYVVRMIEWIERFNGQAIVTHHGRILKGKGLNYYTGHYSYSCMRSVYGDARIHVAGTGVSAFRTDVFKPHQIVQSPDHRMADLVFSLEAAKAGIPIHIVPHMPGYFQDLKVPLDLTCYGKEVQAPIRQGQLADEIYDLLHVSK